jgi:hypothetical protein
MPLGDFEKTVLRLLAVNRSPESYIAGTRQARFRAFFTLHPSPFKTLYP